MIEFIANLVSPIFVPMGVSYADLLKYLSDIGMFLLIGGAALVLMVVILILARLIKKGWRAFARVQAVIAFFVVAVVLINTVCYTDSSPLLADTQIDIEAETLDKLVREAEQLCLLTALAALSEAQRQLLNQVFEHELSLREIARREGVSDNTIRKRLRIIFKKIQKYFP